MHSPRLRPRPAYAALDPLEPRRLLALDFAYAAQFAGAGDFTPTAVATDAAANVYVAGTFAGTADFNFARSKTHALAAADGPAFVAKYDAAGGLVWARQFGKGTGGSATPRNVVVDAWGGVYVVGEFGGTVDLHPDNSFLYNFTAKGNSDAFVIKLRPAGEMRYMNAVASADDETVANGAAVDEAGNVYFGGTLESDTVADRGYAAKFNGNGKAQWVDVAGDGIHNERYHALTVDPAGFVYIAGENVDLAADFIVKFEGADGIVGGWDAILPYTGDGAGVTRLTLDALGNLYAVGEFTGTYDFNPSTRKTHNLVSAGGHDAFVAKYTPAGGFVFARGIGGGGEDRADGVAIDSLTGDALVTGRFETKAYFNRPFSTFRLYTDGPAADDYLARFTADGTFVNAVRFGNADPDAPPLLATAPNGAAYLFGTLGGATPLDLDPGSRTRSLLNSDAGNTDGYLLKLLP